MQYLSSMDLFADLHIHSKYARGCSKDLDIKHLEQWSRIKGLDLVGTGDFTHPKWNTELKTSLKENEGEGIYASPKGMRFMLTTEISLIYAEFGRTRKIHLIVMAPGLAVVDQIIEYLLRHGRVDYDGRPIFKITAHDFVYDMRKISQDIEIVPAHIWTPWFSLFGANSGYDSMKECFQDQEKYIHAIETGMSSDPAMNWRVPDLQQKRILSFSDSHSFWPWRLGREATIFSIESVNYANIIHAIRSDEDSKNKVVGTIEVDPGYGKYHYSGHRSCNQVLTPTQSLSMNNTCPVCSKQLTVGVLQRVEALATKPEGYTPEHPKPFFTLIPLSEIIAGYYKTSVTSKKAWATYNQLIAAFSDELNILLKISDAELDKIIPTELTQLILKNRAGQIRVRPGFDGVYGVPLIYGDETYDVKAMSTEDEPTEQRKAKDKHDQKNTSLSRFM
jgi:uncharacterized protein (TIGR00375 family)